MKTILELIKKKKTVVLKMDDASDIEVIFEVALHYHLRAGETYDDETWKAMIHENMYQTALSYAFLKLKKMLSIFEMRQELEKKGYSQGIIKQVMHHLIERRYLDDVRYAETYLSTKKMVEGPEMILYQLRNKGIHEHILEHLFDGYQEEQIVYQIAENKLNSIKNKTKRQAMLTVRQNLLQKGFHRETVERIIITLEEFAPSHDDELILKAYDQAYLHLSKKWTGYALESKIKEKLYQKGFSYATIQAIIEKKKLQSW